MVCDGLSIPMVCCDGDIGITPWINEQRREAWSNTHQLLWIQVRCIIVVRALQFSPSTLFTLVRTCKYTQHCAIYRWGQTQFHHSSTLERFLVGSDGGRLGQLFLLGKEISSNDCHVSLMFFSLTLLMSLWYDMLVSSKAAFVYSSFLISLYMW